MTQSNKTFFEFLKKIIFKYSKFGSPKYSYNIEPIQLATLIFELERLKNQNGNIVEIGVARGMTTRFLSQHIINERLDKSLHYYAIDTFESFTNDDLLYEVEHRGKSIFDLKGFEYNNEIIWQKNFSDFPFVKAIKSDCSVFNYSQISPIKLTLLDVDLYIPTKKTLPKIYEATINGGVILVDDVLNNTRYDGAYQAYMEFCEEKKINPRIIGNKCGFIEKLIS